ncbi:egg-derived tyrosine phosphatase isoform X2 [Lycorma delicatula]|uniref:egg-derived tyrosine phosphatase isoform X2 n=1 Tax=Lycorma delicatula TaxID=130591 RepID=UPI003F51241F
MEDSNNITRGDIQQLLLYFSKNTYRAKENDSVCQEIMKKCLDLVSLDYSHVTVNNTSGELSANYPSQLIIIEYERMGNNRVCDRGGGGGGGGGCSSQPMSMTSLGGSNTSLNSLSSHDTRSPGTIYENVYDANKLRDLFGKARFARCRARFPLPVIFFRGKHICRSATLSGGPEIYGRSGLDYLFSGEEATSIGEDCAEEEEPLATGDWQLFDRVRSQDIRLLQTLNVGTIVDLMVEKKKVKFGMNVTSSEKVDKENRYSDFKIVSLPYPGCEFFKEYRDNDYVAKGLVFDWNQAYVDATLGVPDDSIVNQLKIDWDKYKMWDLVKLTQNYLRLLLRYLVEQRTGLLVHCISGWDRTPLFVSLLRLSLWADGAIHQSLSPHQILYFTIAYDWMLFGHNLEDRLSKGEDIFFFCFYILKHLVGDEFSVTKSKSSSSSSSSKHTSTSSVLRTDSDSHLDGVLFEPDGQISSQDSNVSLNSSWSSISSKSQETPPILYSSDDTNGNSVPVSHYFPQHRCDSVSCHSGYLGNADLVSRNSESAISICSTSSSSSSSGTERSNATLPTVISAQQPNNSVFALNNLGTSNGNLAQCQFTTCVDNDSDCGVMFINDGNSCCNGNVQQRCSGSPQQSPTPSAKMHTNTSPVAVPSRTTLRQRNESSSSLSVGSWQFITGTGSLRGSSSNSTCGSQGGSNNSHMSMCDGGGPLITDSTTTLIEDDCFIYSNGGQDPILLRERLRKVRELFYHSYCSTIGLKTKDGSEGGIGHFLGNFAEKVGIRSTQRTSV